MPGNASFAIGPAVVLAAVPAQSLSALNGFVIAAARLAQMLVEIGAWATRERLLGLESLREQLGQLWVNGVDRAFTPVALVIALVVGSGRGRRWRCCRCWACWRSFRARAAGGWRA